MKSHAVVFTARNQVEYREVDCPAPGASDVVLEVEHSWISNGTEGSFLRGERTSGDTAWREGDPLPFPIVAGYQKVGRITTVGADVKDFSVGERVFASVGRINGLFCDYGGQVSPSVCDAKAVHHLPAGVDPLACCGAVLTQVGYNCGTRPRIAPGQLAVVVGDGLVGQWAGQALKARGARVIMTGHHDDRLEKFRAGGWGETLRVRGSGAEDVKAVAGSPVHVLVDTVGKMELYDDYLPLIAHCGTVVSAGFYGTADLLPLQRYRYRELSIDLVSSVTRERLDATLAWIAEGKMDTLSLITHRFPVEQAAEAWRVIENKTGCALGVVLDWPASRK